MTGNFQTGSLGTKLHKEPDLISPHPSANNQMDSFARTAGGFLGRLLEDLSPDIFLKRSGNDKELFLELILTVREAEQGGVLPIQVPVLLLAPNAAERGAGSIVSVRFAVDADG